MAPSALKWHISNVGWRHPPRQQMALNDRDVEHLLPEKHAKRWTLKARASL